MKAPDSGGRIPALDGLRGLAILLVLLYHFVYKRVDVGGSPFLDDILFCLKLGWSGVDLFFVLSGFLIGGILLDARASPHFFRTFFIRRICRIFPLYYLTLISFVIAEHLGGDDPRYTWLLASPLPVAAYASYMQNWTMALGATFGATWMGATWSLAIEEQFYVTLPFLVRWLSQRTLTTFLVFWIILAPVLRLACGVENYFAAYVLLPCRADALSLGVLVAMLCRHTPPERLRTTGKAAAYAVLAVMFVIVSYHSLGAGVSGGLLHTWCAVMYASLLLVCLLDPGGLLARIFRNTLLRWLGDRSYGLYMYHLIVLGLCHAALLAARPRLADWPTAGVTALALFLTLVLAHLSWTYFERPLVARGRSFGC